MQKKLFWISVAVGFVGASLLFVYLKRYEAKVSGGKPVPIVIAAQDIALGRKLTKELIAIRSLPEHYVEERHIQAHDVQRILGVKVTSSLRANESLLWSDLSSGADRKHDLASLVEPGMRAVSIPTDRDSTFGGLLRPGDRVDLLFHSNSRSNSDATLPLLQNVLVLAAGTELGRSAAANRHFSQVTLGLTAHQAQLVAHAKQKGRITLTLRHPDDIQVVSGLPETATKDLLDAVQEMTPPVATAVGAQENNHGK